MEMTVQQEKFSDVVREAEPLLRRHYQEIAHNQDIIPLSPDMAKYAKMEAANQLVLVTVRGDGGALAGYSLFISDRLLHNSTVFGAILDVMFVAPEHRRSRAASWMIDLAEDLLRKRGVILIQVRSKVSHPELAMLLASRGYSHVEQVHAKILQRPLE